MAKPRLGAIADDKPVKLTIELSAEVHRDLVGYSHILAHETGQTSIEPAKLIVPRLVRFMAADRAFAKRRRATTTTLTTWAPTQPDLSSCPDFSGKIQQTLASLGIIVPEGRVMPDEILTLPEVATLLKVAEKTVYTMAQKAEMPAFKVRGQWRFKREDIDAWIEQQKSTHRDGPGP